MPQGCGLHQGHVQENTHARAMHSCSCRCYVRLHAWLVDDTKAHADIPFCCPHRLKQQTTLCALAREVIVSCRHNSRRSRHSDPRMDFVTKPLESTSVEALPALPHACSCCRGAVSPPGHLSSKCQLDTAGARLATAAEYESYMKVRGTCLLLSTHPPTTTQCCPLVWRPHREKRQRSLSSVTQPR